MKHETNPNVLLSKLMTNKLETHEDLKLAEVLVWQFDRIISKRLRKLGQLTQFPQYIKTLNTAQLADLVVELNKCE